MKYRCNKCNKWHKGFPILTYRYPSWIAANIYSVKENVIKENRGIIFRQKDHDHCFMRFIWPQKIKGDKDIWEINIWVELPNMAIYELCKENNVKELEVKIVNNIPWYNAPTSGIMVKAEYNFARQSYIITEVLSNALVVKKDFNEGLPENLSEFWVKEIGDNVNCEGDVEG